MAMTGYFTTRGVYEMLKEYFINGAAKKMALCEESNKQTLDAEAVVDKGSGKVGIQCDAHGYAVGALICIEGSTNYDDQHFVHGDTTANEIVIEATYVSETMAGTETIHEAPGPASNTLAALDECPAGNGYSAGGNSISGFDTHTEDDANFKAFLQWLDVVFTADGGNLPASGPGARYPVIVDASDNVIAVFDLGAPRTVSSGQQISLQDAELIVATR